jgi:hypothetical protein
MKASSVASERNSVAWPEVMCSTPPWMCCGVSGLPCYNGTTRAQRGDSKAAIGVVWLMVDAFQVGLSPCKARTPVL